MADAETLRRIALSMEGTTEAPHFDRTAFKVKRIYATIAADRLTANIRFSPGEQQMKCEMLPQAFSPLPNAWGAQGWTVATLSMLDEADMRHALELAWKHAAVSKRRS